MNPAIFSHLTALWDDATARALEARILSRLEHWRARVPAPQAPSGSTLPLSRRDALLITYADQVRGPGRTPLQALGEFADQHLDGLISGIHLLPFYPWTSDDGFSVQDYHAVAEEYGSWADIGEIGRHFDLMFDGVVNHLSAQSRWFQAFLAGDPAFRDFFVTVEGDPDLSQVIRPRALPLLTEFPSPSGPRRVWTTFSADQVDLNARNPEVVLALLDVLLFYVSQGAKFIRLDAIAFLWKEIGTNCLHRPQTHRIIQLMRAVIAEIAPAVMLITETNVPHADNISYFGDGTNEAHLVYNFALPPLVLHTLATGNATALTRWARELVLPSDRVTFFNFLASHDGIGLNPARGILTAAEIDALVARTLAHGGFISYKQQPDGSQAPYEMNINFFDALSSPAADEPAAVQIARSRCAHAIQLSLAGLPGIYFHSLFGSRGDRAGAESSGIPRRINRQKFTRADLERELAEPGSIRAQVFAGWRELLDARRRTAAFDPVAGQEVMSAAPGVFALLRTSPDGRELMLCVHNVSAESVTTALPLPDSAAPRSWRAVVGPGTALMHDASGCHVTLRPYDVLWMRAS